MERVLFAWVHLSDIHLGHGDASQGWDQVLVLGALRADLRDRCGFGAPAPDALLLTGDIGFSGNRRIREGEPNAHEYEDAGSWLHEVAGDLGVSSERVFMVPGNHDVEREGKRESRRKRLVESLRQGARDIDPALDAPVESDLLTQRLANYLAFASRFAPTPGLWWAHRHTCRGGLRLRLVGLNTTLLAADDHDHGKLRLGKLQRIRTLIDTPLDRDELAIVLSHHPFASGWLADEREVAAFAGKYAAIHLSGHLHAPDAHQVVRADGAGLVRVSAGAAHVGSLPPGIPASHGYNVGAIVSTDGGLKLRIWPRRWSEKNGGFVVDADNVRDGKAFSEHNLTRFADFVPLRPRREVVLFIGNGEREQVLATKMRESGHFAFLPDPNPSEDALDQATVVIAAKNGRGGTLATIREKFARPGNRVIGLGRDTSADDLLAEIDSDSCCDRPPASPPTVVLACNGDARHARATERELGAPAAPLGASGAEALRQAVADDRHIALLWSVRAKEDVSFVALLQEQLPASIAGARHIQVVRLDDTPLPSHLVGLDEVSPSSFRANPSKNWAALLALAAVFVGALTLAGARLWIVDRPSDAASPSLRPSPPAAPAEEIRVVPTPPPPASPLPGPAPSPTEPPLVLPTTSPPSPRVLRAAPVKPPTPAANDKDRIAGKPRNHDISGMNVDARVHPAHDLPGVTGGARVSANPDLSGAKSAARVPTNPDLAGAKSAAWVPTNPNLAGVKSGTWVPTNPDLAGVKSAARVPTNPNLAGVKSAAAIRAPPDLPGVKDGKPSVTAGPGPGL